MCRLLHVVCCIFFGGLCGVSCLLFVVCCVSFVVRFDVLFVFVVRLFIVRCVLIASYFGV